MTPEQINRLMAEKVMGWKLMPSCYEALQGWWDGPDELNVEEWDPYHRIEHAMMALEKLCDYEWSLNKIRTKHEVFKYYCAFDVGKMHYCSPNAYTAPAAICLACIEAGVNYGTILHHNSDH